MLIEWETKGRVRCDIVAYAAKNLSGKRTTMRIFPTGSQQGKIATEELSSMIIRAPFGTRLLLITNPGPDWENYPWRCVRMLDGEAVIPKKGSLPGVRIPDLDLLTPFDAKKISPDYQVSYELVESLKEGSGWTFGRGGGEDIKGRVKLIRIEREDLTITASTPSQKALVALAKSILAKGEDLPADALQQAIAAALQQELISEGLSPKEAQDLTQATLS